MSVHELLSELQRRGASVWIDAARNISIRSQRRIPIYLVSEVRRQKTRIVEELSRDNRTGETLTPELIDRYTALDDHSRELLKCFAEVFPGSKIEWKPRKEE